jgi:hypothetical protein
MWRTHRDNRINSTPTNNYITIFIQTLTLYFSDSFRRFRKLPKRVYSEFMSDCMGYLPVYGVGPSYPTPITATTRHFYALKTYCAIFPQKEELTSWFLLCILYSHRDGTARCKKIVEKSLQNLFYLYKYRAADL